VFFSLNSLISRLIFVMVKCGVVFEVVTEFFNNIYNNVGFKGLIMYAGSSACTRYGTAVGLCTMELTSSFPE
jgi:hypothetical protein